MTQGNKFFVHASQTADTVADILVEAKQEGQVFEVQLPVGLTQISFNELYLIACGVLFQNDYSGSGTNIVVTQAHPDGAETVLIGNLAEHAVPNEGNQLVDFS